VWDQATDLKDALEKIGVDQYEKVEYEADDVIASLTKIFKEEGKVYIYTNDKDMLQLVEDGKVIVYKPKVGTTPEKFYDEEAVREQFGVSCKKLGFFRSFDGDASDNIKGVSRVPRKIIASLVNEHANIDEIYNNLSAVKLTEFQKQAFDEAKERIKNNFKIVSLDPDIADISKREASFDKDALNTYLEKYEIKSIKPEDVIDLFSSTLNIKYSDSAESYQLESFNLFS
jgi:DNA polymerase-1